MNYRNAELREKLAAEYALGTLRGQACLRFRRLMQYDPPLRRTVAEWEDRLYPMLEALPEITPPARVWNAIKARIAGISSTPSAKLGLWRTLGLFSSGLAFALIVYLSLAPRPEAPAYMALLNDQKTQEPMLMVSARRNSPALSIKVLAPHPIEPDQALELWALPAEQGKPPQSLGLVSASGVTRLKLQRAADQLLGDAPGLALSLEPKGGSPTGLPTGPILCVGKWLKI